MKYIKPILLCVQSAKAVCCIGNNPSGTIDMDLGILCSNGQVADSSSGGLCSNGSQASTFYTSGCFSGDSPEGSVGCCSDGNGNTLNAIQGNAEACGTGTSLTGLTSPCFTGIGAS